MGSNTTFGFPVPRKLALSSWWVLFSAVARLDLFAGGGGRGAVTSAEAGGQLLGGPGGMLHQKILKYRVFGIAFSARREH